MMTSTLLRSLTLAGLASLIVGCASTGTDFRSRSSAIAAETNVDALESDVKAEIEFGRELAARVLGRYRLYENPQATRYVNLVGKALAMHAQRSEIEYRFAILDTSTVNAYAAPGGYIFLTRGALELMQDESELAAVLAHEIAHVEQMHIVRELNIRGTESSPEAGLARLFGASADPARIAFNQALDKAIELLLSEGLKREDELEADEVGALILTMAAYDPVALSRYLEKVRLLDRERTATLDRTHPPLPERIDALDRLTREVAIGELEGIKGRERFERNIGRL